MTRTARTVFVSMLAGFLAGNFSANANTTEQLYNSHCSECHNSNRLGNMGPALLPENLKRLKRSQASKVIKLGRVATQMPAFKDRLDDSQINQLVEYIYTPLKTTPEWSLTDINETHIVHPENLALSDQPQWQADPMNIFVVVELGDHHATILNGDTFEPIHRFQTRFALHGGPKYSLDGRFVYFGSRDGWVTKYDLYHLKVVAEIRAGINMRNVAVSNDGQTVIAGNYLPHTVVLLDAHDLTPLKIIPVTSNGRSSRVSAVYDATPRDSFVVALKDVAEVWEINYSQTPPPGFGKWIHDYRKDSGDATSGNNGGDRFPVRKIKTNDFLDDFFFSQDYSLLIGASRQGSGQVVDMDLGRVTEKLDLGGMPHLGSGISWHYKGRLVMATPHLKDANVSIIDMQTWKIIKQIPTLGPGFFMRSHENTKYAWVDVFFGPHKEAVHIINKETLEIEKTIRPAPGKTAAHIEFDKSGEHALLSIWDKEGAVIVYNAASLTELKRIPMNKPSGKYNVFNKISRSAGTSH